MESLKALIQARMRTCHLCSVPRIPKPLLPNGHAVVAVELMQTRNMEKLRLRGSQCDQTKLWKLNPYLTALSLYF